MKEQISDYYKNKGFERLYVVTNPEPRRVALLYKSDGTSKTMSYAKYIYTSTYKEDIDGIEYHIDHINGDASNNKRDNLRCICPNCDSQLDTYKNTKNHRSTRTKRK